MIILVQENKITGLTYYHIKCDIGITTKFYGLPKIYKCDIPLQFIASFIGSPTYNLYKFIVKIILPLLNYKYSALELN